MSENQDSNEESQGRDRADTPAPGTFPNLSIQTPSPSSLGPYDGFNNSVVADLSPASRQRRHQTYASLLQDPSFANAHRALGWDPSITFHRLESLRLRQNNFATFESQEESARALWHEFQRRNDEAGRFLNADGSEASPSAYRGAQSMSIREAVTREPEEDSAFFNYSNDISDLNYPVEAGNAGGDAPSPVFPTDIISERPPRTSVPRNFFRKLSRSHSSRKETILAAPKESPDNSGDVTTLCCLIKCRTREHNQRTEVKRSIWFEGKPGGVLKIGSDKSCGLQLSDDRCEKTHALIRYKSSLVAPDKHRHDLVFFACARTYRMIPANGSVRLNIGSVIKMGSISLEVININETILDEAAKGNFDHMKYLSPYCLQFKDKEGTTFVSRKQDPIYEHLSYMRNSGVILLEDEGGSPTEHPYPDLVREGIFAPPEYQERPLGADTTDAENAQGNGGEPGQGNSPEDSDDVANEGSPGEPGFKGYSKDFASFFMPLFGGEHGVKKDNDGLLSDKNGDNTYFGYDKEMHSHFEEGESHAVELDECMCYICWGGIDFETQKPTMTPNEIRDFVPGMAEVADIETPKCEKEEDFNPMIMNPCGNCVGASQFIHFKCLMRWIKTSKSGHCSICNGVLPSEFSEKPPNLELKIIRHRRGQHWTGTRRFRLSFAEETRKTLGASSRADIKLPDCSISDIHAAIEFDRDEKCFKLKDNDSKGGTFIQVTEPVVLSQNESSPAAASSLGFVHALNPFCSNSIGPEIGVTEFKIGRSTLSVKVMQTKEKKGSNAIMKLLQKHMN